MKKLDSYEVLNNEVFYRGMHILDYLYSKEKISILDLEAVKATILCALVDRKLIDPDCEFLDLRTMSITNNFYFGCDIYNPKPFVQGFPLWMKEELRNHSLHITGSLPVSVHAARPAGATHFCIYDANTAFSILFSEFSFIIADYDSPTRPNKRAVNRPFLEADVDGTTYLFDLLTKRMFDKKGFVRRYNMEEKQRVQKSKFDESQQAVYQEAVAEENIYYGSYLLMSLPMIEAMRDFPRMQEYIYEIERSKKYYPEAFKEAEALKDDIKKLEIGQLNIGTLSSEQ